jgi:hypothetical protein
MCAPGDQKKSNDDQREQAELNELQCQRCVDASMLQEEMDSFGKLPHGPGQLPRTSIR